MKACHGQWCGASVISTVPRDHSYLAPKPMPTRPYWVARRSFRKRFRSRSWTDGGRRWRRPDNMPGGRLFAFFGRRRDNAAPGARLVVPHWTNCHTCTQTEKAEADHDERGRLRRRDRMPPRARTRGQGKERTMAVTTTIDSPAAAANTTP